MSHCVNHIPANDPLNRAEQKSVIDQVIAENKERPGAVMLVLNEVQGKIGHVSPSMHAYIARSLNVPPGQVHGVVTFYSFFKTGINKFIINPNKSPKLLNEVEFIGFTRSVETIPTSRTNWHPLILQRSALRTRSWYARWITSIF